MAESAGETGELVLRPRDPRQIAEERERDGDVDAPPEAPALELEFSCMEAARSAKLMFEAAHRGDVGALDAEVAMGRRIHEDEPAWARAREAAVQLLVQTQRREEEQDDEPSRANRFDFAGLADAAAVPNAAADASRVAMAAPAPVVRDEPVPAAAPKIPTGAVAVGVSLEDQVALATDYLRIGQQHSSEDRWEDAIAALGAGRWQLKSYFLEPEPEPEAEPEHATEAAGAAPLSDIELDRRAALTEHLWVALHTALTGVYMRTGSLEGGCYCAEEVLCCEPNHLEALFLRGQMRAEMGDWHGASRDLAHAHRLTTAAAGDNDHGSGGLDQDKVAGAERWSTREAKQQLAMQLDAKRRECDHKLARAVHHCVE
jgi:hypothetical protein